MSAPSPRPPDFDPIARIYRWAEYLTLGPLLQRTRTHFLPQLTSCRHALVLGDGDGRFLARLFQQNPALQAVAVDTSAAMLTLLAKRCPTAKTMQANVLHLLDASPLPQFSYPKASASGFIPPFENAWALAPDLIVTHFFLDCLTQPEVDRLTSRLATAVRPGTLWLLSDFGPPRPQLLKPLAALYIRSLYLAFRVLTGLRTNHLPTPQSALTSAGFARIARHDRLFGLIYTELWQRQ